MSPSNTNKREVKKKLDEVYNIGFKNGQIEMKNKVLKNLNRDYELFYEARDTKLLIKILKKINRIKFSTPELLNPKEQ